PRSRRHATQWPQGGAHDNAKQTGRKQRPKAAAWILGASLGDSQGAAGHRRGARRNLVAGHRSSELTDQREPLYGARRPMRSPAVRKAPTIRFLPIAVLFRHGTA